MTPDIQAIRERAERLIELAGKATDGPWTVWCDDTGGEFAGWPSVQAPENIDTAVVHRAGFKQEFWGDLAQRQCTVNASHIAANDPPTVITTNRALLAALDREKVLEAEVERLQQEVQSLGAALYDANDGISGTLLKDRAEAAEAQLATLRQQNEELRDSVYALLNATTFDQAGRELPEARTNALATLATQLSANKRAAFPASAPKGEK